MQRNPLMDEVLQQPLAELGGRSWKEAFRAAAVAASTKAAASMRAAKATSRKGEFHGNWQT